MYRGSEAGASSEAELDGFRSFLPEDDSTFRMARLLLLLHVAHISGRPVQSLDRLGYYEFFADNPFLVLGETHRRDAEDQNSLYAAGFRKAQLNYASAGHRFASRRRRLQHDLAQLFAYGLAVLDESGYALTDKGAETAERLNSVYADAYRVSASIVLARLGPKSTTALESAAEDWFGRSPLLIDILDDIRDAETPQRVEHDEPREGHFE